MTPRLRLAYLVVHIAALAAGIAGAVALVRWAS